MGAISSLATTGLNFALQEEARQREERDLRRERNRQISAVRDRQSESRRRRQEALRRTLARERARLAAAGVRGAGGSADAVRRGLTEESNAAQQAEDRDTAREIGDIRRGFQSRRRSLLDTASPFLRQGFGSLTSSGRSTRSLLDF
jgi:hypothetical protein